MYSSFPPITAWHGKCQICGKPVSGGGENFKPPEGPVAHLTCLVSNKEWKYKKMFIEVRQ